MMMMRYGRLVLTGRFSRRLCGIVRQCVRAVRYSHRVLGGALQPPCVGDVRYSRRV